MMSNDKATPSRQQVRRAPRGWARVKWLVRRIQDGLDQRAVEPKPSALLYSRDRALRSWLTGPSTTLNEALAFIYERDLHNVRQQRRSLLRRTKTQAWRLAAWLLSLSVRVIKRIIGRANVA
jgi:hypothetical protein